ncbi:hypothetical protein BKA61DRAFT_611032 [Leptodontidium sp. MPI-SDFR-AT-0119]|nr:hypothetical protein BKA61DRAFT_611032 [Leptodontidium sp. MPI-SDFR-AT-0119]
MQVLSCLGLCLCTCICAVCMYFLAFPSVTTHDRVLLNSPLSNVRSAIIAFVVFREQSRMMRWRVKQMRHRMHQHRHLRRRRLAGFGCSE